MIRCPQVQFVGPQLRVSRNSSFFCQFRSGGLAFSGRALLMILFAPLVRTGQRSAGLFSGSSNTHILIVQHHSDVRQLSKKHQYAHMYAVDERASSVEPAERCQQAELCQPAERCQPADISPAGATAGAGGPGRAHCACVASWRAGDHLALVASWPAGTPCAPRLTRPGR
jgi:hypothetical protein